MRVFQVLPVDSYLNINIYYYFTSVGESFSNSTDPQFLRTQ